MQINALLKTFPVNMHTCRKMSPMKASAFMKKLSMITAGVTFITLGSLANAPPVKAAIIAIDDSGSWATGTDTLANLGFNMVTVPDSPEAELSSVSTLSSPFGNLTFSPTVEKRYIGSSWTTWSHGHMGEVYYSGANVVTTKIKLPFGISAFDLYVEPDMFSTYKITVTVIDSSLATLTQEINGFGGAKYFGFYATNGGVLSSVTITDRTGGAANGFAMAEFRLAAREIPETSSVLGILTFCALGVRSRLLS